MKTQYYWSYQGREQNGDYIFKYTFRNPRPAYEEETPEETPREDEYIKVMCPTEAMKLKRRRYDCSECWDKTWYPDAPNGEGLACPVCDAEHCCPACYGPFDCNCYM